MDFRLELNTTTFLIAFNIALFALTSFLAILFSSNSLALDFLGADVYQFIVEGQVWRMVTSSFLHANLFHLMINMYALYVFGKFFEDAFGGRRLISLYVFAGLAGSFLSAITSFVSVLVGFKDPDVLTLGVGASGALFGILGFFIISNRIYLNKQRLYSILMINLLIGIFFAGLIDNWAHIGGLAAGLIFGYIDNRKVHGSGKSDLDLGFYAAILVTILSYLALTIYNSYQIFLS